MIRLLFLLLLGCEASMPSPALDDTRGDWCDAFVLALDACRVSDNADASRNTARITGCVDVATTVHDVDDSAELYLAVAGCHGLGPDVACDVALTDCRQEVTDDPR